MTSSEEEQTSSYQGSKSKKYLLIVFKVLELCLIIICMGLVDDPANNDRMGSYRIIQLRTMGLLYATLGAFVIYLTVNLLMQFFKDIYTWKTSAIMAMTGFILFLACSATLFSDWSQTKNYGYWPPNTHRLDFVCATASVAIITSVVFLIDLVFTVKFGMKGDLE